MRKNENKTEKSGSEKRRQIEAEDEILLSLMSVILTQPIRKLEEPSSSRIGGIQLLCLGRPLFALARLP